MSEFESQNPLIETGLIAPNHRKTRRNGLLALAGCGFISVAGLVGWWIYKTSGSGSAKAVAVTLVPVKQGDVEITVTESGTVELGGQQTLKAPREATVEQVNVKEGDRVQAEQPLLVLRDRQAQETLKDQQVETTKLLLELKRSQEKVATAQAKLNEDKSTN